MIRARFVPPAFRTLRCSEVASRFGTWRTSSRPRQASRGSGVDLNEELRFVVGRGPLLASTVLDLVHRLGASRHLAVNRRKHHASSDSGAVRSVRVPNLKAPRRFAAFWDSGWRVWVVADQMGQSLRRAHDVVHAGV